MGACGLWTTTRSSVRAPLDPGGVRCCIEGPRAVGAATTTVGQVPTRNSSRRARQGVRPHRQGSIGRVRTADVPLAPRARVNQLVPPVHARHGLQPSATETTAPSTTASPPGATWSRYSATPPDDPSTGNTTQTDAAGHQYHRVGKGRPCDRLLGSVRGSGRSTTRSGCTARRLREPRGRREGAGPACGLVTDRSAGGTQPRPAAAQDGPGTGGCRAGTATGVGHVFTVRPHQRPAAAVFLSFALVACSRDDGPIAGDAAEPAEAPASAQAVPGRVLPLEGRPEGIVVTSTGVPPWPCADPTASPSSTSTPGRSRTCHSPRPPATSPWSHRPVRWPHRSSDARLGRPRHHRPRPAAGCPGLTGPSAARGPDAAQRAPAGVDQRVPAGWSSRRDATSSARPYRTVTPALNQVMVPLGALPAIHWPTPMKTTGEATLAALIAHPRLPR